MFINISFTSGPAASVAPLPFPVLVLTRSALPSPRPRHPVPAPVPPPSDARKLTSKRCRSTRERLISRDAAANYGRFEFLERECRLYPVKSVSLSVSQSVSQSYITVIIMLIWKYNTSVFSTIVLPQLYIVLQ